MFVVGVVGQKGGIQKSTIARALAVELASRKKSVVLVDLDSGQETSLKWQKARAKNGIEPSIRVVSRIEDAGAAEYVICDAPGWSDAHTGRLAEQCDLVVLPTHASMDDLTPLALLFFELTAMGTAADRIAVVVTFVLTEKAEKDTKAKLLTREITAIGPSLRVSQAYVDMLNVGRSITEVPQEGLRNEAQALTKALIDRLHKVGKRPADEATPDFANADWSWLHAKV